MPTVILLDVSLSMCRLSLRQAPTKDPQPPPLQDPVEVRQLANVGVGTLLDYLAQNAQLENTSLVIFSSLWEIRNQFTRNHESIKSGIYELDLYDKSNIVNAIRGVNSMKLSEWSQSGVVNIILVTDGQYYATRLASSNGEDFRDITLEELEGQFEFPCKIQVVCLCSPRDPIFRHNISFFKKLVAIVDSSCSDCPVIVGTNVKSCPSSAIWLPESSSFDVSIQCVERLFNKIAELHYKPYHSVLSFGHLSSMVLLSPNPTGCTIEPFTNQPDHVKNTNLQSDTSRQIVFDDVYRTQEFNLNEEISICGFMPSSEIASPAVISRHLVMPTPNSRFNETSKAQKILSQDPNAYNKSLQTAAIGGPIIDSKAGAVSGKTSAEPTKPSPKSTGDIATEQDLTKQPSFCVLLHNSLKQENFVAICIVGKDSDSNDWFGILHPHVDARKRSNLMLSLLLPGPNPIPWLTNFRSLESAYLAQGLTPTIPVNTRPQAKSYSSNNVIWLDPESVQADVQKIVRHVKRGIDKAPHFYKELNRIRRAAISYGFYDVLTGLATILEREMNVLRSDEGRPGNKEIIANIEQVIASLRADLNKDSYETRLIPSV